MRETCPTCGKTTGTLMEVHPDAPGLLDYVREFASDDPSLRSLGVVAAVVLLAFLIVVGGIQVLG